MGRKRKNRKTYKVRSTMLKDFFTSGLSRKGHAHASLRRYRRLNRHKLDKLIQRELGEDVL